MTIRGSVLDIATEGVKESCQQPVEKVHCFTKIEGCPDTICIILI